MADAISWQAGGTASVVAADGMQVTVSSSRPFPPGAPVRGTLAGATDHGFTLKVTGARKTDSERWEIRGRLITPSVDDIAAFARAAGVHTG